MKKKFNFWSTYLNYIYDYKIGSDTYVYAAVRIIVYTFHLENVQQCNALDYASRINVDEDQP